MRIIYYSAHPQLDLAAQTGYGRHMRETIAAMRKAGHEVHPLVMGSKAVATGDKVGVSGLKSLVKKIVPRYIWRSAKEYKLDQYDKQCAENLRELVDQLKPDLIYERLAWLQDSGADVARNTGTRLIVEINAPFEEEVKVFERAGSIFENKGIRKLKSIFEQAEKIVTVSGALRDHLIKKYNAAARKIVVVPNAVNPEDFIPDPDKLASIRTQNKLEGSKIIGFVGSIFPYHGVDILIRAFAVVNVNRNLI
jgi:glycosyltransferase involved in cell wall biosynthesis